MTDAVWTTSEWTAFGSVLSGVGTVLGALAVMVAAWLASNTFNGWRRQALSQRRIEQAERILTATYKVRRGLSQVRSPMLWSYEQRNAADFLREKGELPTDAENQQRAITAQVYFNRLNGIEGDRRSLEECQPMARALFSEQLELAIEALHRQFSQVNAAVQSQSRFSEGIDRDFRERIEAVLWEGYPSLEANKLDREIAEQVATIEGHCIPVLRLEQ